MIVVVNIVVEKVVRGSDAWQCDLLQIRRKSSSHRKLAYSQTILLTG